MMRFMMQERLHSFFCMFLTNRAGNSKFFPIELCGAASPSDCFVRQDCPGRWGSMKSFWRKTKQQISEAFRRGWTLNQVCWSLTLGLVIGLFPIYGTTTILCVIAASSWKLNHVLIQTGNYLISPLKLLLIFPFLRLGEWIFQVEVPLSLNLAQLFERFGKDPLGMLAEFAGSFLHAIVGWAVVVVPLTLVVRSVLTRYLSRKPEVSFCQEECVQ